MSDKPSLFHGWRARTHYLTRDRRFLLRTAAGIIACGLIAASLIVAGQSGADDDGHYIPPDPALIRLHDEFHRLRHDASPQPRALAAWLRMLIPQILTLENDDEAGETGRFDRSGKLVGYDVAALIQQHATSDAPAGLFHEYLAAALDSKPEAIEKLKQKASASPPEMLAAEFYGSIQTRLGNPAAAMQAFFTEGLHFPEAAAARENAVRLAVGQRDVDLLQQIAAQPGWIELCHPLLQHHVGALLGDVWMQWRGLVRQRLNDIPYGMLALAFFAAALWYFILVQHSEHSPWRWASPIASIMAGVCSVWPTLSLGAYQELVQGMTANAPFPHDLVYYLLSVGLREESCKLALFALFLPWLLWRRQPGLALLTGAFVGLGFSLEENIGYYQDYGGTIAWSRFITANFLHISLTGICAHSLYEMMRTRFATAGEFLATFLAVIAAHGGYDWLAMGKLDDNGWLAIVVLVLTVSRFIDVLASQTNPVRLTIAPRAVFTFGSAILIAIAFILGAWNTHSMAGVADAGRECLSVVPIGVLYWRKFANV